MADNTATMFKLTMVPSFRDLRGRWAKANGKLLEIRRDLIRDQARRMTGLAQEEAPKRSGDFAKGIRFRTFVAAEAVGFTLSAPSPLVEFITKGTKPHPIPKPPRPPGKPLAFEVGGETVIVYGVEHPGTKPNPFIGRAYRRWLPGARDMLNLISSRFIRELMTK